MVPHNPHAQLEERLVRPNTSFHPELDFLRSVAVILVVIDHTSLALHREHLLGISTGWLGVVGVWMFFVHTALVLMWSLERKPYTLDFYVRRIFRVYPLTIVAITIATIVHAPLTGTMANLFQYHAVTPLNFAAAGLLIYNLAPARFAFHPIEYVVYTLPFEIDMYVLLPVLFAFIYKSRARWTLSLGWAFACAVAYSSSGGLSFIAAIPSFIPGIIAYAGYAKIRPRFSPWLFPPFLALAIATVMYHTTVPRGWIFSLALGVALPYFESFRASAFTQVCHQVAKYSFGIYLSHPFALWFGCYLLGSRPLALQLTVVIASIAVISVASYHLIELPMIRMGSRIAARLETHPIFGERERSLI